MSAASKQAPHTTVKGREEDAYAETEGLWKEEGSATLMPVRINKSSKTVFMYNLLSLYFLGKDWSGWVFIRCFEIHVFFLFCFFFSAFQKNM